MIPGFVLLALSGLMLWRGFTGQSPIDELRKLVEGEAIFVRDPGTRSVGAISSGTTPETGGNLPPEINRGTPS